MAGTGKISNWPLSFKVFFRMCEKLTKIFFMKFLKILIELNLNLGENHDYEMFACEYQIEKVLSVNCLKTWVRLLFFATSYDNQRIF